MHNRVEHLLRLRLGSHRLLVEDAGRNNIINHGELQLLLGAEDLKALLARQRLHDADGLLLHCHDLNDLLLGLTVMHGVVLEFTLIDIQGGENLHELHVGQVLFFLRHLQRNFLVELVVALGERLTSLDELLRLLLGVRLAGIHHTNLEDAEEV